MYTITFKDGTTADVDLSSPAMIRAAILTKFTDNMTEHKEMSHLLDALRNATIISYNEAIEHAYQPLYLTCGISE
jgi:hypothetical protein